MESNKDLETEIGFKPIFFSMTPIGGVTIWNVVEQNSMACSDYRQVKKAMKWRYYSRVGRLKRVQVNGQISQRNES